MQNQSCLIQQTNHFGMEITGKLHVIDFPANLHKISRFQENFQPVNCHGGKVGGNEKGCWRQFRLMVQQSHSESASFCRGFHGTTTTTVTKSFHPPSIDLLGPFNRSLVLIELLRSPQLPFKRPFRRHIKCRCWSYGTSYPSPRPLGTLFAYPLTPWGACFIG